ncbi:MAG: hypothetical protein LBH11_00520 [Propionibacteriaceae bacterium]|jgi:hypothetical protein|nr:hypothetical protein [Propionibacteriaceae bacterium]
MFHWLGVNDKGVRIDEDDESEVGLDGEWPTKEAAESWLGQMWEELLFYDIAEVTLYDGDELVLGPMKLAE